MMSTKISIVNINNYESIPDAIVAAIKMIENDFHFDILNYKNMTNTFERRLGEGNLDKIEIVRL